VVTVAVRDIYAGERSWSFSDPDEYAARVRGTNMEVAITRPGRFAAKAIRVDLHRIWMQRLTESLPRVAHFNNVPGRAILSFRTQAGPDILWDGKELPTGLIRHPERDSYFQRSTGPTQMGCMSLPIEDMAIVGEAVGGGDFIPPKELLFIAARPAALTRFLELHAAAGLLAENAPEIIANHEAARGLEQALIAAMADCLAATNEGSTQFSNVRHSAIMRRFYAILEANPDRVIHAPEMCRAVGVSNRTLTTCCHEALGMSPHRYLRLRQLHIVRRALSLAEPATTTVTQIATDYGFWELGRFAAAYRAVFGERPSVTLGRPAGATAI
jgi:AraC-like DNA-binding protein